ncbi:MAG: Crp/Fnr family transcriptional regulator [Acidobacteria bacterium]|nr:Crp/Fnr family transcriptional regulator [Acidobacteriota bacterium]
MERTNVRSEKKTAERHRSGARKDPGGKPITNEILTSIPEGEYDLIRPDLEFVQLGSHHILHEQGEKIEFAYFFNQGLASLVVLTSDGRSVEVAIVGHEGVVGTPLAVGLHRGPYRAIMQIPGAAVRVKSDILEERLSETPELRLVLNRYVLVQGLQIAQIAACNRLHEIEQRLARWLLMCQDRVDSDFLPVTHEFLAQMLGTGRPSVSLAAGMLQRAGIIENLRGTVKILNRKELEAAACECYRAIQHFNRSLSQREANTD